MNPNSLDLQKELQQELQLRKKKVRLSTEEYCQIEYDVTQKWLYVNWIGYQTERTVMEGCSKLLEVLKELEICCVLNDNTNVVGIWTPASQWVGTIWFPQMKEAGLKHFAWIHSPSRLSQISADEAIKNTPDPEIIRIFYNLEEGRTWLLEVS